MTLIELALAMTWRAVRMAPWSLMITPVPSPVSSVVAGWGPGAGRVVGLDEHERGQDRLVHAHRVRGSFLASAMPLSTRDCTVLAIWAADGAAGADDPRVATNTSASTTTARAPPIHGHGQRRGARTVWSLGLPLGGASRRTTFELVHGGPQDA